MPNLFEKLASIKPENLKPVYVLYGDDAYLEQEALRLLFELLKSGSSASVEKKCFYGNEDSDEAFIQSLFSPDMFSPCQMVVHKNIRQLSRPATEQLVDYLSRPDGNTLLVLTLARFSRSKLSDTLKKSAAVDTLNIWTPKMYEYGPIIKAKLTQQGYTIAPQALDSLVTSTADSLSHTFAELEKLFTYLGDRKSIALQDVRLIIGGEKDLQISDFLEAVAARNLNESIHICLQLLDKGGSVPLFTSLLYNHFTNVMLYNENNSMGAVRGYKNPYVEQRYKNSLQNYRIRDFGMIIEHLTEVDLLGKSTNLSNRDLMVPLLYRIMK